MYFYGFFQTVLIKPCFLHDKSQDKKLNILKIKRASDIF